MTGYEIRVEGHVPVSVVKEFDGLRTERTPGGTCLRGPLRDQAALYGVLSRLGTLQARLLRIVPLPATEPERGGPRRRSAAGRVRLRVRVRGRVGPWLCAALGTARAVVQRPDTVLEFDLTDGLRVYPVLERIRDLSLELREVAVDPVD